MDKATHDVRTVNWRAIVDRCQERSKDQTVKGWLRENGISEKSYYYWLRKFRREAYEALKDKEVPSVVETTMSVPADVNQMRVAEISAEDIFSQNAEAAVKICTKRISIEIKALDGATIIELVKAVSHAV